MARFMSANSKMRRPLSARQYDACRKAVAEAMSNRIITDQTRTKLSEAAKGKAPWNKGVVGIRTGPCSEERKTNISKSRLRTERIICDFCSKTVDPGNYKQFHGPLCKHNPEMDSSILKERAEQKRQSVLVSKQRGTYAKPKPKHGDYKCPHCGKKGTNYGTMQRWHFNRCPSSPA